MHNRMTVANPTSRTVETRTVSLRLVFQNTSFLVLAGSVTRLASFVTTFLLARYLGVEGFGIIVAILAAAGLFNIVNDLGLSTLTVREIGEDRLKLARNLSYVGSLEVCLSAAVFLLIWLILGHLQPQTVSPWVVVLIGGKIAIDGFTFYLNSVFRALEKMQYELLTTLAVSTQLVATIAIIAVSGNLVAIAAAYLLGSISSCIAALVIMKKRVHGFHFIVGLAEWKDYIQRAVPFAATMMFDILFNQADVVIVALFLGNAATGLYAAAYKLFWIPQIIATAFGRSIMPKFALVAKNDDKAESAMTLRLSIRYLVFLSALATAIYVMLGSEFAEIIYGQAYTGSGILLKVLALGIIPYFIRFALGPAMIAHYREVRQTKIFGVCVLGYVVLNLALVPVAGPLGAAIANTIFLFAYTAALFWYSRDLVSLNRGYGTTLLKPLVAAVISACTIALLKTVIGTSVWAVGLELLVCSLAYLLSLFLLGFFSSHELRAVKQRLSMSHRRAQ